MSDEYRSYKCITCGFVYNETDGLPDAGIAPKTRWKDISEDWVGPDCGVSKDNFVLIEI
ncbi:rubredoxin [Thiotrichales bacterium HSG1]|nr:rubredoxin [Thiotrichales bacterium HSG1]